MKLRDNYARIPQGYIRLWCWDENGKITYDSLKQKNTVVNDARRSAAAAFSNQPGLVGLGFNVNQYRCGYSNTLVNHWDPVNNIPLEEPFGNSTLIPEYQAVGSPLITTPPYFHTQASVSGLATDGLQWVGPSSNLVEVALPLSVTYPFNGDECAVQLSVTMGPTISVGATFDTVEVILNNGKKFAGRWVYPITKAASWSLGITHLILF